MINIERHTQDDVKDEDRSAMTQPAESEFEYEEELSWAKFQREIEQVAGPRANFEGIQSDAPDLALMKHDKRTGEKNDEVSGEFFPARRICPNIVR